MGTTIKDVAREAGVSVATVSRAFNGSGPVRPDTLRRIEDVAERLRYRPHGGARSLITRQTRTVGVLLPDLYGEFFSEVLRGIDKTAQARAHHILVSSSHNEREELEAAVAAMHGRVDGLILMAQDTGVASLLGEIPFGLPLVLLNCRADGPYDSITIANERGTRAVVRHLSALGHRRIAMIKGPDGNFDAAERLRGYRKGMREAGVTSTSALELPGAFTDASGYAAAKHLLRMRPRPTAVLAANDTTALGALSALREAGVAVPDDIAVVGFDDIPMARYLNPPLTTVHVSIRELGKRAVERLLTALDDKDAHEPREDVLPTRLVVRGTCGAPTLTGGSHAADTDEGQC
ncbi:MAG: LacI family DNA-binding transcriptional regulator [Longimicrobiales bacterium]